MGPIQELHFNAMTQTICMKASAKNNLKEKRQVCGCTYKMGRKKLLYFTDLLKVN